MMLILLILNIKKKKEFISEYFVHDILEAPEKLNLKYLPFLLKQSK